uniref:Protein Ycf2 n=1 Tax=Grammatotheca bergiana TaxID=105189 RepID=A0A291F5N6_9ASTR|nr:hypothetical chloroplast RF2 [Grammatotheca bergiana]YP_009437084.1 hypothetical chloroplast RF2 [Grammatotheca bergiana]ATG27436.1 hypothetical chloroplast RF2 [Grammatotheca bergiana]ATG27461.1 hypothetical chloroplast RF2 [Grammatotheca bergiana]
MNIELRVVVWQFREVFREIKSSQSLLKFCNQVNSVGSVIHILLYQERFLKLFNPRIWTILWNLSRTRNSRGLTLRMKITRFFKSAIKSGILFVVAVLIYRMNTRYMVESKTFFLTGLLPTIPMNSILPRDYTLAESVGSSHINRFVASLLYLPKGKRISDSESSFLNLKESTPRTKKSSTNWGLKSIINRGLRWCRRWIIKKRLSSHIKKRLSSQVKESSNDEFDEFLDNMSNEANEANEWINQREINQREIQQRKERSILWDLSFLQTEQAETEVGKQMNDRLPEESEEFIGKQMNDRLPEEIEKVLRKQIKDLLAEESEEVLGNEMNDPLPEESEEVLGNEMNDLLAEESEEVLRKQIKDLLAEEREEFLGNPTRPGSFFSDGWSELHMGSSRIERDHKLLKKQQDLSFVRRSEIKELVNLFKITMYLQNTVSIHPISSDPGCELEERFHEMTDLFTLSITEPDLVYHKGFAFSIDSYGLDQKQFLFNSRDEWKNQSLLVLPPIFYEENESFYRRIRKKWVPISCGNDLEEPKPKKVVFASNNILEAVNQYRLIRNLIQIQYSTYRYIRNVLNRFFLLNRSDRNFEYGIQRDQIGKDTLNHRTLMKYTINQHLSNLKKSQKRWFNPLILISPMNRDPDAYRYKWSTWIKNFQEHFVFEQKSLFPVGFDQLKIHIIEGWFEIIDELSKPLPFFEIIDELPKPLPFFLSKRLPKFFFFLSKRLPKFFFFLSKRLLKFLFNELFVSFRNTFFHRFAIYIDKSKGPNDHSCNPLLESIGLQIVYLNNLKPSLLDDHDPSQKLKPLINGGTISPSLFNKIPKRSIDSFHTRKNRRKSFDNTDSSFSRIFHDQENWLNPVKPFHRSSLLSAFFKANRLRFLTNPHDFCFDCNKGFPYYVEKARIKNYDLTYGQFLNTLFIHNKKFSLCVGKKKHAFWWRDTLSAIESQVSNIFIPDETDNLDKFFSRSDPFVGRANYSIAGISGTPRTEGDVVNLERTYCQSRSDMNLSDSEGKNLHQSLNLNSNMALLHSLCSDNYLPYKKGNKLSPETELRHWLAKDKALAKQKQRYRKQERALKLKTRKKWKLFKTFLPWALTLRGYRYLQALLVQIVVEEFRRLKRNNKFVSTTLEIGSVFGDIIKLSIKVVFTKERIKQIRFFLIKWKMKYARLRKIQWKIITIQRKISKIQRKCLRKLVLCHDMSPRNNKPPLRSTHLRSANLQEFFYSSVLLLLVSGYLICTSLFSVVWSSLELQKEFKMVKMLVMESSLVESEVEQLLDRYPLSESNSFWVGLTNLVLDTLQTTLVVNTYGIRLDKKKYWKSKLFEIINLICSPIDQLLFSINTRYLSPTSKEIYSVLKKRKKGEFWVDEKIEYWTKKSDLIDDEERDVLMQFATFTREKRIDQILWTLTDSDHFSKNEFDSQLMEQPGEIYLRNLIDLHNKDLLNYEFNTSCLAERRLFLALYQTIGYSQTPSEANSADVQKPVSLRLTSCPSRGILLIGSVGLGRSYLLKYLTKTSFLPVITIFLDKFEKTVFRFDDTDEDSDGDDSDLPLWESLWGDPRQEIEVINEDLRLFDDMDIDIDPRAEIYPDMDDHDDIYAELERLNRSEELAVEMDTVWHVAKVYTGLQFELTRAMAPSIIWIPNIHEMDFKDAGSFALSLLVSLLSWDCERSSNERSSNRDSLVIASTHIPRQVQPSLIAPHRLDTCIKIRRPLIPQQQRHFFTLSYTRGFRLDQKAFQANGFAAITMGSNAQDIGALTNEALSISISQGKSIIDENTIRLARHRQTWDLRAHVIPVQNSRLLFYQIGRAVARILLLSNCPIDPISIYLQKRLSNPGDSYLYRSYYELGMSMKKLTILLYLLNCSAGSVAQELWSPPEPNENNRIAYGRLVEDDFELVHGLLEIEGILEGFSRIDLQGLSRTEKEVDKENFDQQQHVEKENFDQQQNVDKENFDQQQHVGQMDFALQQDLEKENFDQQQLVDKENFDQQQNVDKENFDQQQDLEKENFDQQQLVDKENFDQQQHVGQMDFALQQLVGQMDFALQQLVEKENFDQQQPGEKENFDQQQLVDKENFDQQQNVDKENFDQQQDLEKENFDQQQLVDKENFDKQQHVDQRHFGLQQLVDKEAFDDLQQPVEKENFDQQQLVDKENFDQQQLVDNENFDQQQLVEKTNFDQQQLVDKENFDKEQLIYKHPLPLLRRPEPRNPGEMIHTGFSSMIDQKFIYESEQVFIGGRKVNPQKVFSNFIAWAPRIWSPWSFLFDWVERVNDNELGFPYSSCSFWAKQMNIDIAWEYYAGKFEESEQENDEENDSDYDEDEDEPNPNPLDKEEQKKERGLYYKLEDPADSGFEPEINMYDYEVGDKFYEAFLRGVYQTRARIRSSKEQVVFRISQFIWHPGNPFLVLSEDPTVAHMFGPREFFRDTDDEVLKWYVTSEIKSMKKSWLLEAPLETRFEWVHERRRWLRRTDRSLSNASFRSHTLSESYQYLSNLFLSNRTLLDQMKKTLVRKRWLFPDDMQKFFQNFFMEQYDTAETRKN